MTGRPCAGGGEIRWVRNGVARRFWVASCLVSMRTAARNTLGGTRNPLDAGKPVFQLRWESGRGCPGGTVVGGLNVENPCASHVRSKSHDVTGLEQKGRETRHVGIDLRRS
ncbi:hypothetical protein GQ53DRAFT_337623 [Thozetella sp. PMI_491]|nr:hypothetical protein GQ53DRAFT_337623 [Thozetella sp. PMI_491]